jgi:hypothetical protein
MPQGGARVGKEVAEVGVERHATAWRAMCGTVYCGRNFQMVPEVCGLAKPTLLRVRFLLGRVLVECLER